MDEYKLVVVGSGGVGKSCITIRFVQGCFIDEYDPTIEDAYRKQIKVDDHVCLVEILDTAGQSEYRSMRDCYMRVGEGFLMVYSITSRESFEEIKEFHEQIGRVNDTDNPQCCVLVGNKCDLESRREISQREGQQLAKEFGCPFLEVSALAVINVTDCFHELIRSVRKKRFLGSEPFSKERRKRKRRGHQPLQ